jgi:hypothetical protein
MMMIVMIMMMIVIFITRLTIPVALTIVGMKIAGILLKDSMCPQIQTKNITKFPPVVILLSFFLSFFRFSFLEHAVFHTVFNYI